MQKLAADLEVSAAKRRSLALTSSAFLSEDICCLSSGGSIASRWPGWCLPTLALVRKTLQSKANRLALADKVLREGTAGFIEEMLPKLVSPTTRENRPDIVDAARRMMQAMSPQDIAGVQRGIAERPDSISTLKTINVPTLVIAGEDDSVPLGEAELMRQNIAGSQLKVIPKAGHYAALERPAEFGALLRSFLDGLPRPWHSRHFVTDVTFETRALR